MLRYLNISCAYSILPKQKIMKPSLKNRSLEDRSLKNKGIFNNHLFNKIRQPLIILMSAFSLMTLAGCSTTTLPWPDMSISRDEANEALTAKEQDLLSELLDTQKKTHRQQAVKEIEGR